MNIDHHHDNTRFGDVNLVVADASSTAEVLADLFARLPVAADARRSRRRSTRPLVTDTGRFQYSNTTPKALRLASELVEAGRGRQQGVRRGLRVDAVPEAEAPRTGARARAGARGWADRRLRAPARRFRGGRGGGALLGGHHRPPPCRRRRGARRARPRAARRRVDPRARARCARTRMAWTCPRSRAASAAAATRGPPGSRPTSRWTRSPGGSSRRSRPRTAIRPPDGHPEGPRADRRDPGRQAGGAVVLRDRRPRARAHRREDGPRGDARPVRHRAARAPLGPGDERCRIAS